MKRLLPFIARLGLLLICLSWQVTTSSAQVVLTDPRPLHVDADLLARSAQLPGLGVTADAPKQSLWLARPASSQAPRPSDHRFMRWGIAIGVIAGAAAAGIAAERYGENEGGQFCGQCFVRWAAISIPVGAGGGAAVGCLIDRLRR